MPCPRKGTLGRLGGLGGDSCPLALVLPWPTLRPGPHPIGRRPLPFLFGVAAPPTANGPFHPRRLRTTTPVGSGLALHRGPARRAPAWSWQLPSGPDASSRVLGCWVSSGPPPGHFCAARAAVRSIPVLLTGSSGASPRRAASLRLAVLPGPSVAAALRARLRPRRRLRSSTRANPAVPRARLRRRACAVASVDYAPGPHTRSGARACGSGLRGTGRRAARRLHGRTPARGPAVGDSCAQGTVVACRFITAQGAVAA